MDTATNQTRIFNDVIFDNAFQLDGAHLVAASAGTGKTYNIQNIYARLIMEKGLRVSQIQVMTFTEAATKELRERLRTVLTDVHTRIMTPQEDCKDNDRADKLIETSTGGDESKKAAARTAIELALLEFDSAAISTIHGFCSRALARYAFETNTAFSPEIEDSKLADLRQLTRDWWKRRGELEPKELLPLLDFDVIFGYVKELSGKTDWKLDYVDADTPNGFMMMEAMNIVNQYENDRTNRRKQTYDDLLRSMREALNGPFGDDFAARLREEFHAALIDEFQDTDPVQYDIFLKVFLADKSIPVFFVGDPKQAIYAFRGADIFTYRNAARSLEGSKFYLDKNFRSTPRLMDAVNAIFRDRDGGYTFMDEQIDYANDIKADEAKHGLLVDGQEDRQPFRFIAVDGKDDVKWKALAQEVVRTLNDYNGLISPRDIAILVNKKDNAKTIMEVLRQCNVPCAIQNPGNVFTTADGFGDHKTYKPSKMMRTIYDVFLAMARNGGRKQVLTALVTPFFGVTPAEILSMDENALADWIGKFNDINRIWRQRGLGAALAKMQEHGTRDGIGYRERIAAMPNGERMLTDCGQILELAFAAVKQIGPSPDKLVDWLEERVARAEDEDDSDEYARELESENDAVKIMTMHVSKGLQFPVVFLPECNVNLHKNKDGSAIHYHDEENDNGLVFSVLSEKSGDAADKAETEEQQEKLRLLYVAMTRAEKRTVAMYNGNPNLPLQRLMDNAVNNGAGKDATDSPIKWIDDYNVEETLPTYERFTSNALLLEAEKPRRVDTRSTKGSYSSISPSMSDDELDDDGKSDNDGRDNDQADNASGDDGDATGKLPIFQIKGGSNIGSCWHEILEKLPFDANDDAIKELSGKILLGYGFDPQAAIGGSTVLETTVDMLSKTLDSRISPPDGKPFSLRDVRWNERMSELEFNFSSANAMDSTRRLAEVIRRHWDSDASKADFLHAIENWDRKLPKGFMNGFIDLMFLHDGYYYIVDWKSNILGGNKESFTEDGVRHEMAKHGYFFQYLLYAAVLQRCLKEVLGSEYNYERNFGGIRYYFLRGIEVGMEASVFADRPSEKMLDEIGEVLGLEVK